MSRKYLLLKQKNISCKSRQLSWCCISCIAIPRSIWRQWIQGRCGSGETAGRGLHGNGGECPCQQHLNTLATLHTLNTHQTRADTAICTCLYLASIYELIALFLFVKLKSCLQSRNLALAYKLPSLSKPSSKGFELGCVGRKTSSLFFHVMENYESFWKG